MSKQPAPSPVSTSRGGTTSFNAEDLVEQVIGKSFDTALFKGLTSRIDMPKASSIFDWLTNPVFCAQDGFTPWPKQLHTLLSMFEEYCPMPSCTDRHFLDTMFDCSVDEIAERITFLKYGHCPKCKGNKLDFLKDGLFRGIESVSLCLGQRSSKTSVVAGFAGTYILHRLLMDSSDPARYYGLKPNQQIYGTFTAPSKDQAVKYPWTDFSNIYLGCNWFRAYNDQLAYLAKRESMEVDPLKIGETMLEYRHVNVFVGAEAPNKRTLRGATRFFGVIDEFGWFSEAEDRTTASASETEDALGNALKTIRSSAIRLREKGVVDPMTAYLARVSSPAHVADPIMRAIQSGRKSPKVFVYHAATWEYNPTVRREDFAEDFALRPEFAERSFGAVPPLSTQPFHKRKDLFPFLPKNRDQGLKFAVEPYRDKTGLTFVTPVLKQVYCNPTVPYVLSVDPGETQNSFGMVLQHLEPDGSMFVDAAVCVEPRVVNGTLTSVHFQQALEQFIFPLLERIEVVAVVYDRWQSSSHVNQINDFKPFADRVVRLRDAHPGMVEGRDKVHVLGGAVKHTLRFADFQEFDGRMAELSLPRLERAFDDLRTDLVDSLRDVHVLKLLYQIATVREVGNKVTKPAYGDDDVYRAMVNGFTYMTDPKRRPIFTDHSGAFVSRRVAQKVGLFVRSSGVGQPSGGGGGSTVQGKSGRVLGVVTSSRRGGR